MARTIHGDHDRFVETYFRPFPGFYFSGDGARRDIDGHYQITGRVDDVINVKGHRVGTAEIESAMDDDWRVAETAVVGYPHELFGQGIYAFVILRDGVEDEEEVITDHLRSLVQERIGSFAVPQQFLITPGLPKTRSGKIMRRMLRKVAAGDVEDLGDTSTLADSSVVQNICAKAKQFRKE